MEDRNANSIWRKYTNAIEYNLNIDLYETVKENENFYIGKQWEGVNAPDLDKPVFNFIKRVVGYFISMICSDDISISINPFYESDEMTSYCEFFVSEVEALIEKKKVMVRLREAVRDCAVDGDTAMYVWFDPNYETHQAVEGIINVENVDNTNILFGNPYDMEVDGQPFIIIQQRRFTESLRKEAKDIYGLSDDEVKKIMPDQDESRGYSETHNDSNKLTTVLYYFFKEKGTVHYTVSTKDVMLVEDVDLEITRYPVSYMTWEKVKNSYHGQACITGIIPNQIYVNKLFAMCMLYTQRMGFPWTVFDNTKINVLSNQIGRAFGTNPDIANKLIDFYKAPDFSSQIMNLIEAVISYTRDFLGANDASLGNVKPDNTSAIIALQEASQIPLRQQQNAYYQFVEDTIRNMIDMMCATYGTRTVRMKTDDGYVYQDIDFSKMKGVNYSINIDIGSSSPYDEQARITTLGNLWDRKIITDALTFVDAIPDKTLPKKDEIMAKLMEQQQMQIAQMEMEAELQETQSQAQGIIDRGLNLQQQNERMLTMDDQVAQANNRVDKLHNKMKK